MAYLQKRTNSLTAAITGKTELQVAASYTVMVCKQGTTVKTTNSATRIIAVDDLGQFAVNDWFIVNNDTSKFRKVTGVDTSAKTVTYWSDQALITVTAEDRLINLGADTGATNPSYDGGLTIYKDIAGNETKTNPTTTDSSGGYEYWISAGSKIDELIRNVSGTPVSNVQDITFEHNWINVKDYGAKADGTTDDTNAINEALAILATYGQTDPGGFVFFPTGTYKTTSTIYIPSDITIQGEGRRYEESSRIVGTHTGAAVVSCKNSIDCHFYNISIEGNQTTTPKTGICFGRGATGSSAGSHVIRDCAISGYFSQAALYSIASEENLIDGLRIVLLGGGAKYAYYTSQADDLTVDTLFASSNAAIWNNAISISNESANSASVGIYINADSSTGNISFRDCFIAQKNNAHVQINVGQTGAGNCKGPIIFDHVCGEPTSGATPLWGFYLSGDNADRTLSQLVIKNCMIAQAAGATNYIYADDNLVLDSAEIVNNKTDKASSFYEVHRSYINLAGQTCTIRSTCQTNILLGGTITLSGATPSNLILEALKGGISSDATVGGDFRMLTRTWRYASAAPVSGTWVAGDIVWNTAPSAGGAPGWVCTTGGTPGTWKAMANLAA